MKLSKNVVSTEIENVIFPEPEHLSNIEIISQNLDDFNERFVTEFYLVYEFEGYMFTIPKEFENNEMLIWFTEGIGELLAFAYSPTRNDTFDLDQYLENRKKEINYLHNNNLKDQYKKRYQNYAPLGFLNEDSFNYIKNHLNKLLK